MPRFRIGVDIGGTFTDVTGIDDVSGTLFHLKTLTTSVDPALGVVEALDRLGIALGDVTFFSHGTTIAINTLLEGHGARTAILTTEGFRDVLELRRGARTHMLDPHMEPPPLFVPRRWRTGVRERVLWDGRVQTPLEPAEVRGALQAFVQQGIESVAVCFLHSYANPQHEEMVGDIIRQDFPELYHTLSAHLVPEIKEYERISTAALNAYVQPVVQRYLTHLEAELQQRGLSCGVHVMQSNGGVMSAEEAGWRPIHIMESGPAAGAMGAVAIGERIGLDHLITFDMGGTTTKAAVIEAGQPLTTVEFELFEAPHKPGSGLPIRVPMIDIFEVGAGGGSIAWCDPSGLLQVGPQSAGAEPGPVCYGRGGQAPTITDANAVLGRLVALLDGELPLDVARARLAFEQHLCGTLGLTAEEAAAGVLEIADAKTSDVIREVTIARGRDPRDFSLVACGGAGPLQAAYTIGELGIPQAIIPPVPGNFSALGLLTTDIIHDAVRTHFALLNEVDVTQIDMLCQDMRAALSQTLRQEGLAEADMRFDYSADIRYRGQFHMLNVPLSPSILQSGDLGQIAAAFHREHLRLYTYESRDEPTEMVNLRVRATGMTPRPSWRQLEPGTAAAAQTGTRPVYFRESHGTVPCGIYTRDRLGAGAMIVGPAIVEERTSTTLIPPGFTTEVDTYGNLILRKAY